MFSKLYIVLKLFPELSSLSVTYFNVTYITQYTILYRYSIHNSLFIRYRDIIIDELRRFRKYFLTALKVLATR